MERLGTSTSYMNLLTPLGLTDGACEHPPTKDLSIYRTPWKQTCMHPHVPLRCARVDASSLSLARAYRPSHKNLDCASEHIYTLETLEQTAITVQSKNAFAFDSIEL